MGDILFKLFNNITSDCLKSADAKISKNLISADLVTRESKSNGLWCCALLPVILNVYAMQYPVSPLYKFVSILSVGLLAYSILFIIFLTISCLVLKESSYGGCLFSSLLSVLLMYTVLGHGLVFSICFSIPSVYMENWLLRTVLNNFQNTFTLGEAMINIQGIILISALALAKLTGIEGSHENDFVCTVIYTVLLTVLLMILALWLLTDGHRNLTSLSYIVCAAGGFALLVLHCLLGVDVIPRLFHFILIENNRYQLITFWLMLVAVSVAVLVMRTKVNVKASTVARKAYHVLASLVFMSGILLDVELMTLAAGIGFGLLLLVEALRKADIEPISSTLQSAFLVYSDEKDSGVFAVTPLYLYAGLAAPLALVPRGAGRLPLLAGTLAAGVGDTAASWAGAKYGTQRWAGGNRTYEGTAFNILSQIATVYALQLFDLLDTRNALLRASFAATVTGLVEAKTNQVDNLVLPLVTLVALQATWFL